MAALRAALKVMTQGKPAWQNYRLGEDQAETECNTRLNRTKVTTKLFPDGSGIFVFTRGEDTFSIRWNPEDTPLEVFATFGEVAGFLLPETRPDTTLENLMALRAQLTTERVRRKREL